MKYRIFIIILILLSSSLFAVSDFERKIQTVDSKFKNGMIQYEENRYLKNELRKTKKSTVIYNPTIIKEVYKEETPHHYITEKSTHIDYYQNNTAFQFFNTTCSIFQFSPELKSLIVCSYISEPSVLYGRGLSNLKNIVYNPKTNNISGILYEDTRFIAKVDPKKDYLITYLKAYYKNDKIFEINYEKPIKVNNVYIMSKSIKTDTNNKTIYTISNAKFPEKSSMQNINLLKEIKKYNVEDCRLYKITKDNGTVTEPIKIHYDKKDIQKIKSLDELLKISENYVKKTLKLKKYQWTTKPWQ